MRTWLLAAQSPVGVTGPYPATLESGGAGDRAPASSPRSSGPATTLQLSMDALRVLAEERAREGELLDLRRRLPGAERAAATERRELAEQTRADSGLELTEEEQQVVDTLKRWDQEIRQHEAAHVAAAGGLAGTPTFDTVTGPDGRPYAVGGSVKVHMPSGGSPEASADQLRRIKAAATAVSDPSAADLRVAAKAERRLQGALQERARRYAAQAG